MEKIVLEIESLKKEIRNHEYRYYVLDDPIITDFEFDHLMLKLKRLEQEHPELITSDSPTQRVGGAVKGFNPVPHVVPLLSLENCLADKEQLEEFDARIPRNKDGAKYTLTSKVDGCAVRLTYIDGILTEAGSRGNGLIGEDITAQVKTIKQIPLRLRTPIPRLDVRGEIFITPDEFLRINQAQEEAGEKLYANPRNLAAGTVRQKDPRLVAERNLSFMAYDVLYSEPKAMFLDDVGCLAYLKEQGFPIVPMETANTTEEIFQKLPGFREYPIPQDGVVIKVNRLSTRGTLGATSKFPKWSLAWKNSSEIKETRLQGVEWQVGRTGFVCPVGLVDSVWLGSNVSRVTLHNQNFIREKNLKMCGEPGEGLFAQQGNAVVMIHKAGDIIPAIIAPVPDKYNGFEQEIVPPSHCPQCGSALVEYEDAVGIWCNNSSCPARFKESLRHFASRDAMDIEGLGPAVIDQLVETGLVKKFPDLFTLTRDQIAGLERMGNKSASNLIDAIQASCARPPEAILYSLGIQFIGRTVSRAVTSIWSLNDLLQQKVSFQELIEVEGIGTKIASSLLKWFKKEENRELLLELGQYVNLDAKIEKTKAEGPLSGLTFVITGTLPLSRDQVKAYVEVNGGKVTGSISKRTNYLLAGDGVGATKTEAARKAGTLVITWEEFLAMLES